MFVIVIVHRKLRSLEFFLAKYVYFPDVILLPQTSCVIINEMSLRLWFPVTLQTSHCNFYRVFQYYVYRRSLDTFYWSEYSIWNVLHISKFSTVIQVFDLQKHLLYWVSQMTNCSTRVDWFVELWFWVQGSTFQNKDIHYNDVTWASLHLKSLATSQFVLQLAQANSKASHNWPCVKGVQQWQADFSHWTSDKSIFITWCHSVCYSNLEKDSPEIFGTDLIRNQEILLAEN